MIEPEPASMNPSLLNCADSASQNTNQFNLSGDANDPEVQLAESLSNELNRIASAPFSVYLLLDTTIDPLYGEDKNSQYSEPILDVIGYYSPAPLKFELTKWGIDSDIDLVVIIARNELLNKCNRLLQHGDLILDKHNRLFIITEVYDDANFKYEWINQYVMCKRKASDTTILLGDYNNPSQGPILPQSTEKAAGLPPSPDKSKADIRYDDLYNERIK